MQVRFFDIDWDTDGESQTELGLPTECVLEVADDTELPVDGADCLSNEWGWCVNSFDFEFLLRF